MIGCETGIYSQCPHGASGNMGYDTTVSTGSGDYSTQFKFPKFHPGSGLITCARLRLTITDRVAMALENNVNSPAVNCHCEIELSKDGYNFSDIYSMPENSDHTYKFIYTAGKDKKRNYFLRIKQVYPDGCTRFSKIKSIESENTNESKINIYPNPSNGVVGIKFVNIFTGIFLIQISNTQGQTVFSKK